MFPGISQTLKPTVLPSFFAGAKSKPRQTNRSDSMGSSAQPKPPIKCAFCDGPHVAVNCQKYADAESRIAVVKRNKLCFNCLGRHQVSACKSKRRCQKCHRKHHTSICQTPLANQQQNNLTTDAQTLTNVVPDRCCEKKQVVL